MDDKQALLGHIEIIHTTDLGYDRIRKNLQVDETDIVRYCKNKILDGECRIYRQGKNWYCEIEGIRITINANSYTVITAHRYEPEPGETMHHEKVIL